MRSMNSVTDSSNSHVQIVCVICNESIFTDVLAIEFSRTGNMSVHDYGTPVYDGVTRDRRPTADRIAPSCSRFTDSGMKHDGGIIVYGALADDNGPTFDDVTNTHRSSPLPDR